MPINVGDVFSVTLDIAPNYASATQTPPVWEGFPISWAARSTDGGNNPDWWIDPLTGTLMIRPLQLKQEWPTSTSADYARLRLTDFSYTGTWSEVQPRSAGDYYLLSTSAGVLTTNRVYMANQPLFVSFVSAGPPADDFEIFRLAFGQYTANIFAHGGLWLQTGGEVVRKASITPGIAHLAGQHVSLLVLPFNRRQILFWSPSHQGGFVFTDYDLDDEEGQTITDAGAFSCQFPTSQGMVQLSHVIFERGTAGVVEFTTPVKQFHHPPAAGSDFSTIDKTTRLWSLPNKTDVDMALWDETADSVATWDGEKTAYRIHYELQSYGASIDLGMNPDNRPNWTPFVRGASIDVPAVFASPIYDAVDVSLHVVELSLSFEAGKGGITASVTLDEADVWLEDDGYIPLNRILTVFIGDEPIFLGLTQEPEYVDAWNPETRTLTFPAKSLLAARADSTDIPVGYPFDGKPLDEFAAYLLEQIGFDSDHRSIPTDVHGLKMPSTGKPDTFACEPQPGEKVRDWMDRIEEYFGYVFDERNIDGKWTARLIHPDDPADVVKTLYRTPAPGHADHEYLWSWRKRGIFPACNEMAIIYCDQRGKRCMTVLVDEERQDPTLAKADRPRGHLGERRWAEKEDSSIRTETDAVRMLEALALRPGVFTPIDEGTGEGEYDPNIYPYDFVTVEGEGDWRVVGMQVSFNRDTTPGSGAPRVYYRPCQYRMEQ